ncbi:MAG: Isoquinoline 1-oxidoreductase subunit [Thermoanaerobaculia bacterium]|nr:Isoquinoline 1-oxidoreductase subunit [Thermoanaerobaculia bacterium]
MTKRESVLRSVLILLACLALGAIAIGAASDQETTAADSNELRPVTSFDSITDPTERSKALFVELSKVLLHPRCVNCHPAGDQPLQGQLEIHEPPVWRGKDGEGAVGMHCTTCHTKANYDPAGVPGAPHWSLAPAYTAWEGKSVSYICAQIQDPERNGGMDHEALILHMEDDPLVGWAWHPGGDREPVPGTQEDFSQLVKAWIATGAACPDGSWEGQLESRTALRLSSTSSQIPLS